MILSEKSATFRDHAFVRSHDLVRKVCNFSGSCCSASEHRDELTIRRCPRKLNGSAARPAGVCEGAKCGSREECYHRLFFHSRFRRRAHKICRSTGWKNRKPICCPP